MFIRVLIAFALSFAIVGAQAQSTTSKSGAPRFEVVTVRLTRFHAQQSRCKMLRLPMLRTHRSSPQSGKNSASASSTSEALLKLS